MPTTPTSPCPTHSADIAIEGWSFAHACGWFPNSWRHEIGQMIAEMKRILKPGGTFILLETLGTGYETPTPPTPHWPSCTPGGPKPINLTTPGFAPITSSNPRKKPHTLTRFFFGDELADRILADQITILPECTGIWWGTV